MPLDMALGSKAPMSFRHRCQMTAALLLIVCVTLTKSAPTTYDEIEAKQTDLTDYFNDPNGCYYNYQHYEEGDRIVTNEPCLNCTCHNRMLMCYLRVCPFSKAIGQDCTVQKSPDQCCPVISCPEVPVHLLTSSTTQRSTTAASTTTEIGWRDDYGCMMNENGFFPDGAQVPTDPKKPCELCYCIRNRTACVMQECTLHVDGCRPVYQDGVCCPVRYDCDYESEKSTTSAPQISGGLVFSTTSAPFDCKVNDEVYRDGESIAMVAEKPCEHCYCMRGDIVCAVQDCGEPLRGKDCTPETPPAGQCCPTSYQCPNETMNSYDSTTLQPVLLSDSDGNEAEKYPSNEDVYEKLGENQPSQQDDTNDVHSEQAYTTTAYDNEIPSAGTSDQTTNKNEETHDSVPENTAGGSTVLPESDSAHLDNGENKPESDPFKYESTGKPVELSPTDEAQPTQSPAADPSLNENIVSPTTQTTFNENNINEGNNDNESPVQIQDGLATSSSVEPTESSVESETQSSNTQDRPQEGIQQQTDTSAVAEKEPIQSINDEQNVDIKSPTETTSDANQDPVNQSNEGSTENYIGENNFVTVVPLSEDADQTTQKSTQSDNVQTLGDSNTPTDTTSPNNVQNNSDQTSQGITQSPQEDNLSTDNPANVEPNLLNNDKTQEENVYSTEIPKVVNEPVENKPQEGNRPESEITPTEKYQDNPQEGNAISTEIPKIENEPSDQNKPLAEHDPQNEEGSESDVTSTEQNQDDSQSPTEVPKVENESTEQNKPLVENSPQTENQPESVQTPVEPNNQVTLQAENISPTEIPKLENEPTEQNKPLVEGSSQTEIQPESDKILTEQNQDSIQENASPTQIPTLENEPTEQNKPLMEGTPQTAGIQPESDQSPAGLNQDSTNTENASPTELPIVGNQDTQSENALSTEIPNIESDPTEQNKPLVESSPQTEGQTVSDQSPTGQNQDSTNTENASPTELPIVGNQDTQSENTSPTQIPSIENEPTEQNQSSLENSPQTESQPESDKTPTQQNQDSTPEENASSTELPIVGNQDSQSENSSPTQIPSIGNEPTEQNQPLVENSPQTENQSESDKTPTKQNQDSNQNENALPTEIPSVESEPTEQNKPLAENSPQTESQPESDQATTEQNQDSTNTENASPTQIPTIGNEPTDQNQPLVESSPQTESQPESDQIPTKQNQDGNHDGDVSPTLIPITENEPTEQNKPLVESSPQTESQPESDKTPTDQNQDSTQGENVSPTELPQVGNQDPQSENKSPTEIPKVENEPTENNEPLAEKIPETENQPESDKIPTEQNNQGSPQSENVSPTEIPNVQHEQNNPLVENNPQTENPLESDKTSTEQNQDSVQGEKVSPTETPKVESESTEQNKPLVDSNSQAKNQSESDKTPTEQNQDSIQENSSPTQIPNIESEPTEQNKPIVENSPHAENQPEPPKTLAEENQDNPLLENVSSTEIPSKLNEPQSENAVTENAPVQPVVSVVPVNDVSTEHSIEDNNIFVVEPTSPSLFSQNQVKGDESTSTNTGSENIDQATAVVEKNEDKIVETPPTSADDKTPSTENTNVDSASPIISTENIAPENNNVSPQTNDENTEHSTETKPIGNEVSVEVSNDVTIAPVDSNESSTPIIGTGLNNKFGSNDQVNSEPSVTPTTESNYDVNSGIINQDVLVDDVSSQENDSVNGEDEGALILDPSEHQVAPQTESPVETQSSTNEYPPAVNEPVNDVTTSLPQQQVTDNSIPVIPVEAINPSEPVQLDDKTKTPSDLSENSVPEKSQDSHVPTEVGEVQHTDEITKPTESPALDASGVEQSVPTQSPVQINENESVTPHVQSQDENVNEIGDQTSVYPDTSSNNENNLNTANGLIQNNEESSMPLSDKIETSTNAQISGEEPIQNNDGIVPVENESSTTSQTEQVNQGSSENADNIETTNSYTEIPSVASITNAPTSIAVENDANPSVNPSNDDETNVDNDHPANVVPQQSVNADETSTQYNADDISTNSPIQESPNANVNNNVETSSNIPSYSEIPNEVNQDSITESELYATQSPTEKNVLNVDSNKTPTNDATMEAISNLPVQTNNSQTNTNEIINGNPSESSDNAGKPTVSPDYVIDITTVNYSELPSIISGPIETEDQPNALNDITTSNIDKNSDATTELYDNIQAGVPGEGSCLIDFVTYAHKAEVPKSNPCHEKCECLNSIVTCTSVNCPPAPPQHRNCIPLHPGNESWCCPTYMCEGGIEGVLFESNNQLGSPQLISTVVLEDKPGEENDDKTHVDEEVPSTSSPQIASEYNTLPPSQADTNVNSQDSIGITEVPAQSEIPNKPSENSVSTDGDNDIPATTVGLETVENDKPIENNKPVDASDNPVESEQPSENEKPVESDQPSENDKPVESDQPSENDKPVESDQPSTNEKPVESDQTTENGKPIDDSEAGVTTASYATNEQTVTNKPEVVNNIEEQSALPNVVNESQDNLSPSTEVPNYESVTNVIPTNDQNLPEQNAGSDDTVAATTFKPSDSIVDQQVDDNKTNEDSEPTVDDKFDTVPVAGATDLPTSDVKPLETTQTPTIIADANPTAVENNVNGLRPTSIDDIISSVNMVKDAVKNSLETSSKPAEIDYQTTTGSIEDYQPTVLPENAVNPSSENALVDKYDEPQTTASSVNVVPELQTDDTNEKLPDSPAVTVPSDEVGSTQVPNIISSSANADQGVSTELPSIVPDKQEITTSPPAADVNVNGPEGTVDDKIADVTTAQNVPVSAAEHDHQTSNGPIVATSDPVVPQVDVESNTNLPEAVTINDKTPEVTTQVLPSLAQQEVLTDDTANKPTEQEKPTNAESPVSQDSEANADHVPEVVPTQSITGHSSSTTEHPVADTSEDGDKRFGVPSSSPASTDIDDDEDTKRPQEASGDMMNIPFVTEKPLPIPSSSTPASAAYASSKPSYTPIPQSTWTQKPFHQDSTSEAPQPDQGFPDEYDDENEAVYGPGTCRYGGKIYVSAQQVPREDPCDFCFCFRGDIICLQQSCPPPIFGCYQENIQGFCCPRYECPVAQATSVNVTTTTTTTTTMVPPHFFANAYRGAARRTGCLIHGHAYRVGEDVGIASGPCLECICGADGKMKCDPKPCSPEPMLRKIMAEAVDQRKR